MAEIKEKLGKAKQITSDATPLLNEVMREKVHKARKDPRVVALEVIQLLLVLMVALAGFFFLLPDKPFIRKLLSLYYPQELVEEYLLQLPQPPLSYVLFAVVVIAAVWVYSYTNWYRHERKQSRKLLSAEIVLLLLIFLSAYLYFDPALNAIPEPFGYVIFGSLIALLIIFFIYIRFFRE